MKKILLLILLTINIAMIPALFFTNVKYNRNTYFTYGSDTLGVEVDIDNEKFHPKHYIRIFHQNDLLVEIRDEAPFGEWSDCLIHPDYVRIWRGSEGWHKVEETSVDNADALYILSFMTEYVEGDTVVDWSTVVSKSKLLQSVVIPPAASGNFSWYFILFIDIFALFLLFLFNLKKFFLRKKTERKKIIKEIKEKKQELESLQEKKIESESDLNNLKAELREKERLIKEKEMEIERLQKKISELLQTAEVNKEKFDRTLIKEVILSAIQALKDSSCELEKHWEAVTGAAETGYFVLAIDKILELLQQVQDALKEFSKQGIEHSYLGNVLELYELALVEYQKADFEQAYYHILAAYVYVQIIVYEDEEGTASDSSSGNGKWKDYYQILGIKFGASLDEIKRAYREKVKQYHPDRGGDQEKFIEIQEAYDVLSNYEERIKYDELYEKMKEKEEIFNE